MSRNGEGTTVDVAIAGGGIIALALAWRARARGLSVTVLEREELGRGASHVAAGMLAPVSEVEFGAAGRRALQLGLRSARMWPGFAAELEQASGAQVVLRDAGTMMVARDGDEARELERQIELRHALQLRAERLLGSEARAREPALVPGVRLALELPDDHSVDPRRVLAALVRACRRSGVQLREQAPVRALALDRSGERVEGLTLEDGTTVRAGAVVLALGSWTAQLEGVPPGARVPVRPVKGQIMRLRDRAGPGLAERAIRYAGGYLLPRGDGRYVLGATVEERGFDAAPTAGALYEMLRRAWDVVPGVAELQVEELTTGFRPGTPDNVPALGPGALEGLVWATGHYRNGILLAPLTAELLAALLAGEGRDELLQVCDPLRFAHVEART
jgi:glycine oxidase